MRDESTKTIVISSLILCATHAWQSAGEKKGNNAMSTAAMKAITTPVKLAIQSPQGAVGDRLALATDSFRWAIGQAAIDKVNAAGKNIPPII